MAVFKVYHGVEKPLVARGRNQCRLLGFAAAYPGWHSAGDDRATQRALDGLARRGAIVRNRHGQFAIAYGQFRAEAV